MDWEMAQEMAVLSLAAYGNETDILHEWYDDVVYIEDRETDTEAYLLGNGRIKVLAIRGTDSKQDWLVNSQFGKCRRGVPIHHGFVRSAYGLLDNTELPDFMARRTGGLHICGHSKGGAVAQILGTIMMEVHGVWGFGSPMVGGSEWRRHYHLKDRTTLFVNFLDPITVLPPFFFGYRRTKKPIHLFGFGHSMESYLDKVAAKSE